MNKSDIVKNKAKNIQLIAIDIDGVLTDGSLFIGEDLKEPLAKFSIYDGIGIKIAHDCGLKFAVLSGRQSLGSETRCKKLGIEEVYTGVLDKKQKLEEIVSRLAIKLENVAYMGDDIIDLQTLNIVGLKVAPPNAVQIVKENVDFVTKAFGGHGALRELIEYILISQNKYDAYIKNFF